MCLSWEKYFPQPLLFDLPELLLLLLSLVHIPSPSLWHPALHNKALILLCFFTHYLSPLIFCTIQVLLSFVSWTNIVLTYLLALKCFIQLMQFYTSLCIILHSFSFLLEFAIFLAPNTTYSVTYHSSRHISNAASSNGLFLENLLPSFLHCTTVCLPAICILLYYTIL